jgi:hypothetical protein
LYSIVLLFTRQLHWLLLLALVQAHDGLYPKGNLFVTNPARVQRR